MTNVNPMETNLREAILQYLNGLEDAEIVADDIMRLFTIQQRELLDRVEAMLPEKLDERPHNNNPMWKNYEGYNRALDQVKAALEGLRKEMK